MALSIPSLQDIYNKIKVSIFSYTSGQLQVEQDPPIRAIVEAQAKTQHAIYNVAQDAINQTFAQTVTDEAYLSQIAFDRTRNEVERKNPDFAQGTLVISANTATDIPAGTQFIASDGEVYESLTLKTISTQQFIITSLVRVDGYAIGTLIDHELGNTMTLTISGSSDVDFNGDQEIEVLTADTFRYANAGSDASASGTIMGSFLGCRLTIQSINAALLANKTYTDVIDLASTIDEVDAVYITYDGITGGTDIESFDDFKSRTIENLATPQNKGNRFQHQSWAKQNSEATFAYFYPSEDDFYLYLTGVVSKVNDDFTFTNFSTDELTAIRTNFISENQLILGVEALNLTIINPTFVNIDITITDLTPNTLDMKSAIALVVREYLSLIPIKFYMTDANTEVLSDKIKLIVGMARDSNGNTPSFSALVSSGDVDLDSDTKKPILGTIIYT